MNLCHADSILNVRKRTALELPLKEMMDSFRLVYEEGTYPTPFTPLRLISEITQQMDINKDSKIAVMFTCEWALFLRHQGYKNVTLITDKDTKFFRGTCGLIGAEYITLDQIGNRKFDIVVGNPPYADESKKGSYNSLWDKFVIKAFNLISETGSVTMITPRTWLDRRRTNSGNGIAKVKTLIENHATIVQTEGVAQHFNVGSTFSFYSLTKQPSSTVKVNGVTVPNRELMNAFKDDKARLVDKLMSFDLFQREEKTSAKGNVSKEQSDKHPVAIIMTHKRDGFVVQYAEQASRLHNSPKAIFMARTVHNRPIIDLKGEVSPPTGSTASVFLFDTEFELKNFDKIFDLALFKFLIKSQRTHHGFLSMKTTYTIPKVDLTKSWTDEELYEYFNLTPEEINLIETCV